MSDGGKGSSPRPYSVDRSTFGHNWDMIFKRNRLTEQEKFDRAVTKNEYYDLEDPDQE